MYTLRKNTVTVIHVNGLPWQPNTPKQDPYRFPKSGECVDCESYCGPDVSIVVVPDY